MTNEEKKELARLYYTANNELTQKDICSKVGVSEQSFVKWKKDGNWEKERHLLLTTRSNQLARLYAILDATTADIESRGNLVKKGDMDNVIKATAAIKHLETELGVSEAVDVCMSITKFMLTQDFGREKVKELTGVLDAYIKYLAATK
jgi:DNA-binding XRE family transcriptional regulator